MAKPIRISDIITNIHDLSSTETLPEHFASRISTMSTSAPATPRHRSVTTSRGSRMSSSDSDDILLIKKKKKESIKEEPEVDDYDDIKLGIVDPNPPVPYVRKHQRDIAVDAEKLTKKRKPRTRKRSKPKVKRARSQWSISSDRSRRSTRKSTKERKIDPTTAVGEQAGATPKRLLPATSTFSSDIELEEEEEEEDALSITSSLHRIKSLGPLIFSSDSKSEEESESDIPSESLKSLRLSYLEQASLASEFNFFTELGEVPNLSDVELSESSIELKFIEKKKERGRALISQNEDSGYYVDPITGKTFVESSSSDSLDDIKTEPEPDVEEEYLIADDESVDSVLMLKDDDDLEFTEHIVDDTLFTDMLNIELERQIQIRRETDAQTSAQRETKRLMAAHVADFLEDILTRVIDAVLNPDPHSLIRKHMNKMKVMEKFIELVNDLDSEQKACLFLNRKVVEYYRRKKSFRSITEDNPHSVKQEIEKFRNSLENLDEWLGKEREISTISEKRIQELKNEAEQMEKVAETEVECFENLVKQSLLRENFEKLSMHVASHLTRMRNVRDEISKVRLVLIQRQHLVSYLREKLARMDKIGENLYVDQYEQLHTETLAISGKINDRDMDMERVRTRCNTQRELLAHFKNKRDMLSDTLKTLRAELANAYVKKREGRRKLFLLKVNHGRIRKEMKDLSYQGGLVDKPELMVDYDETVKRINELEINQVNLKAKYAEIQEKIDIALNK